MLQEVASNRRCCMEVKELRRLMEEVGSSECVVEHPGFSRLFAWILGSFVQGTMHSEVSKQNRDSL